MESKNWKKKKKKRAENQTEKGKKREKSVACRSFLKLWKGEADMGGAM